MFRIAQTVLILFTAQLAFGQSNALEGKYYIPYTKLQPSGYQPESVFLILSDGTWESQVNHGDAREITKGTYQITGPNTAVFQKPEKITVCPNVDNEEGAQYPLNVQFKKEKGVLTMKVGDGVRVTSEGTPAEIDKFMKLPECPRK